EYTQWGIAGQRERESAGVYLDAADAPSAQHARRESMVQPALTGPERQVIQSIHLERVGLIELADRFLQASVALVLREPAVRVISIGVSEYLRESVAPLECKSGRLAAF